MNECYEQAAAAFARVPKIATEHRLFEHAVHLLFEEMMRRAHNGEPTTKMQMKALDSARLDELIPPDNEHPGRLRAFVCGDAVAAVFDYGNVSMEVVSTADGGFDSEMIGCGGIHELEAAMTLKIYGLLVQVDPDGIPPL